MPRPSAYPVPGSLFGRRHVVLPRSVGDGELRALAAEAAGLPAPPTEQDGAGRTVAVASLHRPVIADMALRLCTLAAAQHLASPFEPTEACFVTQHPSAAAPRRERRYYLGCTASVVLTGAGTLTEHGQHDRADVLHRNPIGPGDVVLLRGWSPLGAADPRPYVRVVADGGPLLLLRLRQNLIGSTREQAWLPLLTEAEKAEARARARR